MNKKQTFIIVIMDYIMYQYVSIYKEYQKFFKNFYIICDEIQQNYLEAQLNVKLDKDKIVNTK